jgi:hypothetical protein
MTPLEIIKYIVDRLDGTAYAPWVNALLFMLLAVAVLAAVSFLVGSGGRASIKNVTAGAVESIDKNMVFAPTWDARRQRWAPYFELLSSLYFALVGLYSAVLVGLSALIAHRTASWWAIAFSVIWVLASFFYIRINLAAASWAQHAIAKRER